MLDNQQFQRIAGVLPLLGRAEPALVRAFRAEAYWARIPAGRDVFVLGSRAGAIALLLSGVVRVYKIGETGREITLYRFGHGESCILTANAIMSQQAFPAIATVEEAAEAVMIPADVFRDWVGRYAPWRDFLFDLLSQRLVSMMEIVDEVAFQRVDVRVAAFLLERGQAGRSIAVTHREIAAELGSSREVISRIVKSLSADGLIRTGRGEIEIVDPGRLRARTTM